MAGEDHDDHRIDEAFVRTEGYMWQKSVQNISFANEAELSLCSQLMLVSTVFLTVSVVVLGDASAVSNLNLCTRVMIIIAFSLIVSSIASGIAYYLTISKSYEKWGRGAHEHFEKIRDQNFGVKVVNIPQLNKESSELGENASTKWLLVQIALLGVGAACCLAVLSAILLS